MSLINRCLLASCILVLLFVGNVCAQSISSKPVISYQGMIVNADGSIADSGAYRVAVSIWTAESGGEQIWSDEFVTNVARGVFNIQLGSAKPLPSASAMDKPLWISISINGAPSALRAQLSAVPMAMNVADSSITSSKMATDYVSSISVNGQKVTSQASNLNIVGGDGVNLAYDDASNSLVLNAGTSNSTNGKGAKAETADTTEYWSEIGNNSVPPPHFFLGTSDSEAFEIHVNNNGDTNAGNGRVMRYEPMPVSPNVIGGFRTNAVSAGAYGATISGGGSETDSNKVFGNFGTIGGGLGNTVSDGGTIAGGSGNSAFQGGTVSGGGPNFADNWATVGGGTYNYANGNYATVGGGEGNTAQASISMPSTYPGLYNTISGGYGNDIYGTAGAIPGGAGMSIGSYSFGFNGDSSFLAGGSGYTDLSAITGIGYFGNVNLMIGNVDSLARQLRFYGPNTDHTYGSGAKFTSFQAPSMDSNVFYVLPKAQGDTNTVLTEDGHGNLSWASQLGALDWSITGNFGTHAPTNFIGTLDSQAFEIHLFDTAASTGGNKRVMRYEPGTYSPNIIGGSSANFINTGLSGAAILSGGASTTPNAIYSNMSVISGGESNDIVGSSGNAVIGGGNFNVIDSFSANSTIAGGDQNYVGSNSSTIGGGSNNSIYDSNATISGGFQNRIDVGSPFSNIGGGTDNYIGTQLATIGGGKSNVVTAFAPYSGVFTGNFNYVEDSFSVIVSGGGNLITSNASFASILGGSNNNIASDHATIAGGDSNSISYGAPYASILGGKNNITQSPGSVIVGGTSDSILVASSLALNDNSFIGAGSQNKIEGDPTQPNSAADAAIVAGTSNFISDSESFVGAGNHNTITEQDDFIVAGTGNSVLSGANSGSSGIGAGDDNTVHTGESMIASGSQNKIDTGGSASFIAAGAINYVNGQDAFVGTGTFNWNFAEASAIISGQENQIEPAGSYSFDAAGSDNIVAGSSSFIGTGQNDTTNATGSFVGAGTSNVTDTGSSSSIGQYAAIIGGDHLRTQSYAQTVLGFYNVPAGSTVNDTNSYLTSHADDPLVIVGNGKRDSVTGPPFFVHFPRRSDAALISNNGHISAFQTIDDGGALGGTENTHMGTIYSNNTIIACGNVQGLSTGFTLLYDIGVCNITRSGASYLIDIHKVTDQDAVTVHTFIANDCAITASISQGATGTPGMISVQPITSGGTFHITTFNSSGQPDSLLGFMFQVVAK